MKKYALTLKSVYASWEERRRRPHKRRGARGFKLKHERWYYPKATEHTES